MIYDENSKTEQKRGSNNIVKDWQQFANDGMLWLVNMILHIFGWAIIYQYDNESQKLVTVFPARVDCRGFDCQINKTGYEKISKYMRKNAKKLYEEAKSE